MVTKGKEGLYVVGVRKESDVSNKPDPTPVQKRIGNGGCDAVVQPSGLLGCAGPGESTLVRFGDSPKHPRGRLARDIIFSVEALRGTKEQRQATPIPKRKILRLARKPDLK